MAPGATRCRPRTMRHDPWRAAVPLQEAIRAICPVNRRGDDAMKATQKLHALGQSLWLDNITRDLLTSGTLQRYIDELSITGLTSNPTIFDHAVARSHSYDEDIGRLVAAGKADEALFFELAVADLVRAADLFAPIYQRTA